MVERINYFEYLGLNAEASMSDIKEALAEKKDCFVNDGIDELDIKKLMANADLREKERQDFIKALDTGEGKEVSSGFRIYDDNDDYDVGSKTCWNCQKVYEYDSFLDNSCPNCNAESTKRAFIMAITDFEDGILKSYPKAQLEYKWGLLNEKYGKEEYYSARETLDSLRTRMDGMPTLDRVHDDINKSLHDIEACCNRKQIYTAYAIYEGAKHFIHSEGCHTDHRIVNLMNEYRICNEYLESARNAHIQQNLAVLFPNAQALREHCVDCKEVDDLLKSVELPSVENLIVINDNHKVKLSWDYEISGAYFSIYKSINGADKVLVADYIHEKEFTYNEDINGATVSYFVWAHCMNIRSLNNPFYEVMFYDNVSFIVEGRVSGAIAFHWSAPVGYDRILVCREENRVPMTWKNAYMINDVFDKGFIDKDVKRGCKYGYRIKCIYKTPNGEIESKSIPIGPYEPLFEFSTLSVIDTEVDYYQNVWNVKFHPISIGDAVFFKSSSRIDVDETVVYSEQELAKKGLYRCNAEIGTNKAMIPLTEGEKAYFYSASIDDGNIYLNKPVEIFAKSSIAVQSAERIGTYTIRVEFTWGAKSKKIVALCGENDYFEEYRMQSNVSQLERKKEPGESDYLDVELLPSRKSYYPSLFEIDELGNSRLIAKLSPLSNVKEILKYAVKVQGNQANVTVFFDSVYTVGDIHLCRKYSDEVVTDIDGISYTVTGTKKMFRGIIDSFSVNVENIFGTELVLRFDDLSQSRVLKINGRTCEVILKEKK